MFIHNIVDDHVTFIKATYDIDLIDLRIKALKGKVYLIEKKVWDHIEELIYPYQDYYNLDILFGGLVVKPWGKLHQFYSIKGAKSNE